MEERETLQFMVGVLHRLRPFVPLPRAWSLHAADPSPPRMAATPRVTAATAGTAAASTPPRGKRGVKKKEEKLRRDTVLA